MPIETNQSFLQGTVISNTINSRNTSNYSCAHNTIDSIDESTIMRHILINEKKVNIVKIMNASNTSGSNHESPCLLME